MTQAAINLLQQLRPDGPWVLTAITPDGPTRTITAHDEIEVRAFIEANDGKRNLYYSVNPTRGEMTSKAAKTDIAAIEYLLADLDPNGDERPADAKARYRAALETFKPDPTAVIDSGNGIQVLWKLAERIELDASVNGAYPPATLTLIADVEARSAALMKRLGCADTSTKNIDRILRLPGTTNLPNKKKLKAGRVECPTKLEHFNGAAHSLEDFPAPVTDKKAPSQKRAGRPEGETLPKALVSILKLPDKGAGAPVGGYDDRSAALFGFIKLALKDGIDDEDIIKHLNDDKYQGCAIYEHCQENGGESYIKRQIEKAANETEPTGDKPIIKVRPGKRHEVWRATQQRMIEAKCQVFVRGGMLVEPLWRWEKIEDKDKIRGVLNMKFVRYNNTRLSDQIAHHAAEFQRRDARAGKWQPIDPPNDIVETLLTRGDWQFETARGIINTPTLRRDGSLLDVPGYDRATGLWYKPPLNFNMPTIDERPTRDDALAALKLLNSLLDEFPFVDDVARTVALAGLMTPVLRGAFKVAPFFFIPKPTAGTGASYLVELISCLATGRPAAPLKASKDPKELAKELSAAAFEAKPILNLNNLTFDLESSDLAQMVTEGTIDIRPFGKNTELVECDCLAMTIYVNGNNIVIVGELVRRELISRLNAEMECPEQRPFKRPHLVEEMLAERGKYLAAVFTIARAYKNAGEPRIDEAKSIVGFEEFSRWVQRPLIWLDKADVFISQEGARDRDPELGALRAQIGALVKYARNLGSEYGIADIHRLAIEAPVTTYGGARGLLRQDLFDAFSRDGKISVPSISKQVMKILERWIDGYHLELASKNRKTSNTYQMFKDNQPLEVEPLKVAMPEEM